MRKLKFTTDHFYHIYNRGVEKRNIFLDKRDYWRFIYSLFEFNDLDVTTNLVKKFEKNIRQNLLCQNTGLTANNLKTSLVDIVVFCIMPNHFHLVLKQSVENGITKFLHKLSTGYTKYFNLKYERVGRLFQGTFKAIHIDRDEYLIHLSRYIHLNPVEIIQPNWKEQGVQNWKITEKFLEEYKWSSYPHYIGNFSFNSLINKNLVLTYFKDRLDYKKFVKNWLTEDLKEVEGSIIEA